MADFNSEFWHWYIAVLTVISILACVWLLRWMTSGFEKSDGEVENTGHIWDDDLRELDNPPPRWWMRLRILLTVIVLLCLAVGVYL